MRRTIGAARRLAPALALLLASGCAGLGGLGTLEDVLGGMGGLGTGDQVRGEVGYVDERSREIEVRTSFGRTTRLRYDSRTEVIHRDRRYSVRSLERGDRVEARVQERRDGELYADRIYVERSVRDGGGGGDYGDGEEGRVQRFDGRAGWVDQQRGRFQLRSGHGSYTVSLPYNPGRSTTDRFRRLRSGDSVRLQGELLGRDRVELVRFD